MRFAAATTLIAVGLVPMVSAHCKITGATGNAGGSAAALGIKKNSGNSESDVGILKQKTGFGTTPGGGKINAAEAVPAAMQVVGSNQLPQVTPGGSVNMVLHQVNADGAGPMACSVNTDATGESWQTLQVMQNVPGTKGLSKAKNQDFQLQVQMPQNAACTGQVAGQNNVCMVKCQNPVGPFGGVVPVQMATNTATAGNATAATGNASNAGTTNTTGNAGNKGNTANANPNNNKNNANGNSGENANANNNAAQKGQNKNASKNQKDNDKRAEDIDCDMEHETADGWTPEKRTEKRTEDIDCDMEHETADGWTPEKRSTLAGRAAGVREVLKRAIEAL